MKYRYWSTENYQALRGRSAMIFFVTATYHLLLSFDRVIMVLIPEEIIDRKKISVYFYVESRKFYLILKNNQKKF